MKRTFYVCTYGGSGSKMLCKALQRLENLRKRIFISTEHIHSRKPPMKLEYVGNEGGGESYGAWFNGVVIPDEEVNDYDVIFIYRNPIDSILSRFDGRHLDHIQIPYKYRCPVSDTTIEDVVSTKSDLYGITEFYNNYTKPKGEFGSGLDSQLFSSLSAKHGYKIKRNYKIHCVKYEDIFKKQDELSELLGISGLGLVRKERNYENKIEAEHRKVLEDIYGDLINEMNNNPFIFTL